MIVDELLNRWLTHWHGRGEPDQWAYYRCQGCKRLVSWKAIRKGGCTCGESNKLMPTGPPSLSRWRIAALILFPWWVVR